MSPRRPSKMVAGVMSLPSGTWTLVATGRNPYLAISTWRYLGNTTRTSWPRWRSSLERDAATSDTPPSFAKGASSAVATNTLRRSECPASTTGVWPGTRMPRAPDGGTTSMSRPSRLTTSASSNASPARLPRFEKEIATANGSSTSQLVSAAGFECPRHRDDASP